MHMLGHSLEITYMMTLEVKPEQVSPGVLDSVCSDVFQRLFFFATFETEISFVTQVGSPCFVLPNACWNYGYVPTYEIVFKEYLIFCI